MEYGTSWITWWNAMQPPWRRNPDAGSLPLSLKTATGKQDAGVLRKSGPNGIVTTIIGLMWWGKHKASDERWEKAVVDVVACLNTFSSNRNKRKGNGDDTHPDHVAKKTRL